MDQRFERLIVKDGIVYLEDDGKYCSKIGISSESATLYCGSYASEKKTLTILLISKTNESSMYINFKWGKQDNWLKGDVLSSYKYGPVNDRSRPIL